MIEYLKIQSIFKRHKQKPRHFIEGEFTTPELEYLQYNEWIWTEKINGTNIRIGWEGKSEVEIGGRTDDAQIPTFLLEHLNKIFTAGRIAAIYKGPTEDADITLFGEGYGAEIGKGSGLYKPDGVDFILFDIRIGDWWLKRDVMEIIADGLGVRVVPIIGKGSLWDAVKAIKQGVKSTFGDFLAEGMVLQPSTHLVDRAGRRIITKIKHRDFPREEGK